MTQEQAISLYDSKWWEEVSDVDIVMFQLFEDRLCVPFSVFHKAIESCLKRSVYTHEVGLDVEGLRKEFLGERKAPTWEEIINLIPKDKRIIII